MGVAAPLVSPYVQEFADYLGRAIRVAVTFDNTTRLISQITLHRDAGCRYTTLLVGLGADGSPDSSVRSFNLKNFTGDRQLSNQELRFVQDPANGIDTIEGFASFQITAGV
jgi:hypothetical protein